MSQIDFLCSSRTHSLYCFKVKDTVIAKDNTSNVIRNIIDHNLKNLRSEVFCLRLKNPDFDTFKEKIHAISIALYKVLDDNHLLMGIIQIVVATAGLLVVGTFFVTGIILVPLATVYLLFKASQHEQLKVIALLCYAGLLSHLQSYIDKILVVAYPYYFNCEGLFKLAISDYCDLYSRFISECNRIPKEYLLTNQVSSCINIELESILNLKAPDNKFFDPITNTYFDFDGNSSAFIRIGRYVLPIRSFIEFLIKSRASNINEVVHPFHQNRLLSHDEIEKLKTDFFNFFSCDFKVMNEIMAATMPDIIRQLFHSNERIFQYAKAKLFSLIVAKEHPHFSALEISRFESYQEMTSLEKDNVNAAISQIRYHSLGLNFDS